MLTVSVAFLLLYHITVASSIAWPAREYSTPLDLAWALSRDPLFRITILSLAVRVFVGGMRSKSGLTGPPKFLSIEKVIEMPKRDGSLKTEVDKAA